MLRPDGTLYLGIPAYEKYYIKIDSIEKVKEFNKICKEFTDLDIFVQCGRYVVDAKSIMGLFSLDLLNKLIVNVASYPWNPTANILSPRKFEEQIKKFTV